MSTHIPQVLLALIQHLVNEELLELVPGARPEDLVLDVITEFDQNQGRMAQFGSAVSAAIIRSSLVEELYLSDADVASQLNHLTMG